jgi:hypothetical protein
MECFDVESFYRQNAGELGSSTRDNDLNSREKRVRRSAMEGVYLLR